MDAIFNFDKKYDVSTNSDLENLARIKVINISGGGAPPEPSGSNVKITTDSYSVISNSYVAITAEVD